MTRGRPTTGCIATRPDSALTDTFPTSFPTRRSAPQLGGQQDMQACTNPRFGGDGAVRHRRKLRRSRREHVVLRRVHLSQPMFSSRRMHAGECLSESAAGRAKPVAPPRRAVSPRDDTRAGISESLHTSGPPTT